MTDLFGTAGAQAITAFGIDTSRPHWDMTSISLYGAYDQTDDEYAAPKFGHPEDRRVDLNRIQAGLAVAGDGGIPVFHSAYDGGAGEVAHVVAVMTELTKMTATRDFLLIADSNTGVLRQRVGDDRGRCRVHRPRVRSIRTPPRQGKAVRPRRRRSRSR
ncbi:hypothetical protein [Umezawaea sp. Da 62-37]|uniref:hypothetical protein n=1 Tax=Umezawaea sp. Da 62-37 TaxID=3075927 RepID=UPI0028F6F388|nr:hypothetical protein [Umezawaea sp. Da 62-37]WNV87471.1 hypothetical protein RM788_03980 [Umezawaea sp. Da 62-37]